MVTQKLAFISWFLLFSKAPPWPITYPACAANLLGGKKAD